MTPRKRDINLQDTNDFKTKMLDQFPFFGSNRSPSKLRGNNVWNIPTDWVIDDHIKAVKLRIKYMLLQFYIRFSKIIWYEDKYNARIATYTVAKLQIDSKTKSCRIVKVDQ